MYDVLLPSFIAGFAAFTTTQFLGINYTYYDVRFYENVSLDLPLIAEVVFAGVFFGIIADLFVTVNSWSHKRIKKYKLNPYAKAFLGGIALIIIASVFGENYLGLGLNDIKLMLNHDGDFAKDIPWYAFIIKTFTTSITLGSGGSGGIITPIFYVGAASGHLIGMFLHEHIALFAALGFVSVVAGATNAPIAATIMAVELFGLEIAHYAAISAVISFLITGHRSVFSSQILAMKKSEILSIKIGQEIEKTHVQLQDKEAHQILNIRNKLQKKREKLKKERKELKEKKSKK
jgi:H+/Cl- antiporter ClcA